MELKGRLVDIRNRRIFPGIIRISEGKIQSITADASVQGPFILPGFVDAHVHIESSMLTPAEFGRMAVVHSTVATVSDPHEIANVLGMAGVQFMLDNAALTPLKCCFGAPSCVPATAFETAGAVLEAQAVTRLLANPSIRYLSEMMNFPGVLHRDPEVMTKIAAAKAAGKPIDGHAPGLRGEAAQQYFSAGISTDHECFTYEEGREKAQLGVNILIREGSAAKNFEALIPLLSEFPGQIMFCSDDKHPDDLIHGHINLLVRRALAAGHDLFDVLQAACIHPVVHYGLPVGTLREGDPADFILVRDLETFEILSTWIDGREVARNGKSLLSYQPAPEPNQWGVHPKRKRDIEVPAQGKTINVIRALDGELITEQFTATARIQAGWVEADPGRDLLKIAVVNRYADTPPAIGFIQGFGLKSGAIASSVAHDSHNIIAVGTDDDSITRAVNWLIRKKGGIVVVNGRKTQGLPLPLAGIMTAADGYKVARQYSNTSNAVKKALGSNLASPFMTLSFMALLVIPALKMSDRGLFDGVQFRFQPLFDAATK